MSNFTNNLIPYVIEKEGNGERSYDLYSRLLKDRIVMVCGEVTDQSMNIVTGQLLFLNSQDSEKPIFMYIDSPGGSCTSGISVINIMNYIKAPVYTICLGMAASMGAALLSNGEKGHRYALKDSTIMTHQAIGGYKGSILDAEVDMEYFKKLNDRLANIIASNCGKTLKEYKKTVQRDNYMFAEEALKYGIIDQILEKETDF